MELTVTKKRGRNHYFINGNEVPSVTTILKDVINAPGLMGWARKMSKQAMAKAVSTEQGYLLRCINEQIPAHNLYDSISQISERIINNEKAAYKELTSRPANFGKETHELIQKTIQGIKPEIPEHQRIAIADFHTWYDAIPFNSVMSEMTVAHDVLNYAGTTDFVGIVNNRTILVDFKTSKAFYSNHAIQIAGYILAYEHMFKATIDEAYVCILGKKIPSIKIIPIHNLPACKMGFMGGFTLYNALVDAPWGTIPNPCTRTIKCPESQLDIISHVSER